MQYLVPSAMVRSEGEEMAKRYCSVKGRVPGDIMTDKAEKTHPVELVVNTSPIHH
jgi:hypothetical protein